MTRFRLAFDDGEFGLMRTNQWAKFRVHEWCWLGPLRATYLVEALGRIGSF